ncbi:phospholipase domain-containing protein [Streptomyces cirratus]
MAAAGTASYTADLAATGRWYDVKVVSDADATFLRRFAGHVETGAPASPTPRSAPSDGSLRPRARRAGRETPVGVRGEPRTPTGSTG